MIIILFIILIFIILVIIAEHDRLFNIEGYENQNISWTIYDYYIYYFPMPILGIFNHLVRKTNSNCNHYFDESNYNSCNILKNNFKNIKKEALNILKKNDLLMNFKDLDNNGFQSIDNQKNKWKIFIIKWMDKINENAYKNCPFTSQLIDQLKDVRVAMFSILMPGKYIPKHKGPSTGCLRYHLGIKIPKDKDNCYIKINNEKFNWNEGEGLLFDDTYVHEVYNNTNEPRIVLFVDIDRPLENSILHNIKKNILDNPKTLSWINEVNNKVEKSNNIIKEPFTI